MNSMNTEILYRISVGMNNEHEYTGSEDMSLEDIIKLTSEYRNDLISLSIWNIYGDDYTPCSPMLLEFIETIHLFTNLETLSLSRLDLHKLPDSIANLVNLKCLYLNHNNFSSIPKVISQLSNLEELEIKHNGLSNISEHIGCLVNLTQFDVSYNDIIFLPKAMGKLINLETLVLSHNSIKTFPKSMESLTKLELLYIDNNRVQGMPEFTLDLENLNNVRFFGDDGYEEYIIDSDGECFDSFNAYYDANYE